MDVPVLLPGTGSGTEVSSASTFRAAAVVVRDHLRVVLQGDVDISAGPVLVALADAVAAHGLPVQVDASRVTFLDCSGLSAVLALGGCAPALSLRGASPPVALLLQLTGQLGEDLAIDLDELVVVPLPGA